MPLAWLTDRLRLRAEIAPGVIKTRYRHMDSDKAEQHDNHVQRDDGHEQDDENLQSGRDERQSRAAAPIMWAIDLGSRGEACERR
jgi:hypothetical protein